MKRRGSRTRLGTQRHASNGYRYGGFCTFDRFHPVFKAAIAKIMGVSRTAFYHYIGTQKLGPEVQKDRKRAVFFCMDMLRTLTGAGGCGDGAAYLGTADDDPSHKLVRGGPACLSRTNPYAAFDARRMPSVRPLDGRVARLPSGNGGPHRHPVCPAL